MNGALCDVSCRTLVSPISLGSLPSPRLAFRWLVGSAPGMGCVWMTDAVRTGWVGVLDLGFVSWVLGGREVVMISDGAAFR